MARLLSAFRTIANTLFTFNCYAMTPYHLYIHTHTDAHVKAHCLATCGKANYVSFIGSHITVRDKHMVFFKTVVSTQSVVYLQKHKNEKWSSCCNTVSLH